MHTLSPPAVARRIEPPPAQAGSRWGAWPTVLGALLCVALSALVGARELGLFKTSLSIPLRYAPVDDTKFYLALVKGVLEHGWWTTNPSLGAPFGQQLYDFPQGADSLNLLLIRGLGIFSSDPATVANLFLLLTFPLTALSAFLVLRAFRVSRPASVMAAVIFSLLPYHFWRGESQLLLSAYYSVPLAAYLWLSIMGEAPLVERRAGGRRPGAFGFLAQWATRRTAATLACCLIVASAGLYYAAFALVLIIAGPLLVAAVRRRWSKLLPGAAVAAVIVVVLGANLSPSLVYRAEHGSNPRITRTTADTEAFGLKLAGLVLPVRQHRLGFLSDLNSRYFDVPVPYYCEACYSTLGTVGDVGFFWLGGIALASVLGIGGIARGRPLERRAALGVALSLVIATVGGVSGLIALFVTADVRGWSRMSLFIAFFSLLAAGLLLDRLSGRMRARGWPAWLGGATIGAVLVLGVADETSRYFLPVLGPTQREWRSDSTFTRQIETRVPRGASIFQLPQIPFPEGFGEPVFGLEIYGASFTTGYDLMRGYLHSSTLRWSYGAMKGRPADWTSQLATKPLSFAVHAAAVNGFAGLWIDLQGYDYKNRPDIKKALVALTGSKPLVSRRGDLEFFDLRPVRAALATTYPHWALARLRADTLHPLATTCTATGLRLDNPSPIPRAAALTFTLALPTTHPKTVVIRFPGRPVLRVKVDDTGHLVTEHLLLPPGEHTVTFAFAGPPVLPHSLTRGPQVYAPDISDDELRSFYNQVPGTQGPLAGKVPPNCVQTVLAVPSRALS